MVTKDLLPLRPYQREAIDAVTTAWAGGTRRPAVVLPTGMGKTVVFSHLLSERHRETSTRSVVLVHRDELADQAVSKLRAVAPHLYVGKVKAEANEVGADVVVASVQTLARGHRFADLVAQRHGRIGTWVTDECHHGVAPTYAGIYAATKGADHVGFTATLARSDGIGLGSVWDDVVYSKSLAYAVKHGYLVRPHGISVAVSGLDLGEVKRSRGDYQTGDLGQALQESDALQRIAAAYLEHAKDRAGVVFTPTVATAHAAAEELRAVGITAAVISGETPRIERLAIYRDFADGRVQVLCNCMVLTEGFDAPHASCAVIARPTQSNPLYVQMVGRVLRPFPGKQDALVLDVVGASEANKLMTLVNLEEGLWPQRKRCEDCGRVPCTCPCPKCGEPRPCSCSGGGAQELVLKGTGAALDLFASSKSAWLQTRAGVWFVPCGNEGEVFLWPNAGGGWDVAVAPKRGGWVRTEHTGMPLETAMAWAEAEAEERGAYLASRGARWRKAKPSEAQANYALNLGIQASGLTRGELSDLIAVDQASRKFDRHVPKG